MFNDGAVSQYCKTENGKAEITNLGEPFEFHDLRVVRQLTPHKQ